MVCIVTPRFVLSEWCRREVEEFFQAVDETSVLRINNKARIFKVVKSPVSRDKQPQQLQGLLGYEFFEIDEQSGVPYEFLPELGDEAEIKFFAELEKLVYDLADLLILLKGKQETK